LAVADVGGDHAGVAVLLVLQLADGHGVAAGRGLVELGEHLLAEGRVAQHLDVILHAADEFLRTLDGQAAAQRRVQHHVDHGVAGARLGADAVGDGLRRMDHVVAAVVDHGGVVARVNARIAGARVDQVVAQAADQDVLPGDAVDRVVAGTAVDIVDALAAGDAVVACAAIQYVASVAEHADGVVAGTALHVIVPRSDLDHVVARAAGNAVVTAAKRIDDIVALATFNDEVDAHTRVDLDGVVAVARADGDLL